MNLSNRSIITLLLFIFAGLYCTTNPLAKEQNPLVGTWYYLSGEYTNKNDEVTKVSNESFKALRTMNEDTFAVVNMGMGHYKGFIEGKYKLEKNEIVEWPLKSSGGDLVGKKLHFTFTLEDDIWIVEGQEGDVYIRETWIKLD